MALQNADILKIMESESGQSMQSLRVDGGASANNLLMQLQANYLDRDIVRPELIETTVAGACFLAGLAEGVWSGLDDIRAVWRVDRQFDVDMEAEDRELRFASWNAAIAKTLHTSAS